MIDVERYLDVENLAILYSGGADSTLLYYLVIENLLAQSHKTSLDLLIVDRFNNPLEKAIHLYNKIKSRLGDTISQLKIVSVPEDTPGNLEVLKVVELVENKYDLILWGVNRYPDDEGIRPQPEYTVNFKKYLNHKKLKLPFAHYSKADIIKVFFQLGIDDILEQTHSCGRPAQVPCGLCFNCRERAWAYKQLGLDPNLGI